MAIGTSRCGLRASCAAHETLHECEGRERERQRAGTTDNHVRHVNTNKRSADCLGHTMRRWPSALPSPSLPQLVRHTEETHLSAPMKAKNSTLLARSTPPAPYSPNSSPAGGTKGDQFAGFM